jgi:hypothetical protein
MRIDLEMTPCTNRLPCRSELPELRAEEPALPKETRIECDPQMSSSLNRSLPRIQTSGHLPLAHVITSMFTAYPKDHANKSVLLSAIRPSVRKGTGFAFAADRRTGIVALLRQSQERAGDAKNQIHPAANPELSIEALNV